MRMVMTCYKIPARLRSQLNKHAESKDIPARRFVAEAIAEKLARETVPANAQATSPTGIHAA